MESGIVVQSAPRERWQIALEGKHPEFSSVLRAVMLALGSTGYAADPDRNGQCRMGVAGDPETRAGVLRGFT
jgi:hypothetical protein